MSDWRTRGTVRHKPEAARDRLQSARQAPRQNDDTRRDDEHSYADQGIRKDARGQEQPADKKRASENR
jgi:hypothetical protein